MKMRHDCKIVPHFFRLADMNLTDWQKKLRIFHTFVFVIINNQRNRGEEF